MKLPQAPPRWEPGYQNRLNTTIEAEDRRNRKAGADIELVQDRLILRSPNGSRFVLTVSDGGVLSAVAL